MVWRTYFESSRIKCITCHCTEGERQVGCNAHTATVCISCNKELRAIEVTVYYYPNCRYFNEYADDVPEDTTAIPENTMVIPENTTTVFSVDELGALPNHYDPIYGRVNLLEIVDSEIGRPAEEWAAFLSSCNALKTGTPFAEAFKAFSNIDF